jgi:outer membrane lipoprotein carrier protein
MLAGYAARRTDSSPTASLSLMHQTSPHPENAQSMDIFKLCREIALSMGILAACFASPLAHAGAREALKEFVESTKGGKAAFTQRVVKANGLPAQNAEGTFSFSRPSRFRWEYTKPYAQSIVGDGEKLWIYDKDLNQVTVKKLSEGLAASPAAILAGSNDLEKNFTLTEGAPADGMEWLDAKPKTKETGFDAVRLGFVKGAGGYSLAVMELKDSFGQTSILRFGVLEKNPAFAPGAFTFTPPKGADVIGN